MTTAADVNTLPALPPHFASPLVELVIEGLVDDVRSLQREVLLLRSALGSQHATGRGSDGAAGGVGRLAPRGLMITCGAR